MDPKTFNRMQDTYDFQSEPDFSDIASNTWTCCGGILLTTDEKCPICGEEY